MNSEEFRKEVSELNKTIAEGVTFEELILKLVTWDRKISFLPGPNADSPEVLINVDYRGENIAIAATSFAELFSGKVRNRALPEQMHKLADQEGYTADLGWFETRNKRLNAKWNEKESKWVFPARALREITLSYLCSSGGFVTLQRQIYSDCRYFPFEAYHAECVFFGSEENGGWSEQFLVYRKRLQRFTEKQSTVKKSATMKSTIKSDQLGESAQQDSRLH
ncbi:hypothetical protein BVY02_00205 [bacterium J17]|nr:hypothetical protein BVY02_00205 [bacterium J17]